MTATARVRAQETRAMRIEAEGALIGTGAVTCPLLAGLDAAAKGGGAAGCCAIL